MSAATELRSLMEKAEVKEELGRRGITWKVHTKESPLVWELLGKTCGADEDSLGRRHASLQALETIVMEIEAILNDHPLTFVSPETSLYTGSLVIWTEDYLSAS